MSSAHLNSQHGALLTELAALIPAALLLDLECCQWLAGVLGHPHHGLHPDLHLTWLVAASAAPDDRHSLLLLESAQANPLANQVALHSLVSCPHQSPAGHLNSRLYIPSPLKMYHQFQQCHLAHPTCSSPTVLIHRRSHLLTHVPSSTQGHRHGMLLTRAHTQ
jgi:hypothetical protein